MLVVAPQSSSAPLNCTAPCPLLPPGPPSRPLQYFSLWLLPNRYLRFSFLSGDPLTEAECLVAPGASTATCTIYTRRATAQGVSQVLTEEVKLTNVRIQPATGPGPQPTGDKPPGEMPV